MKNKWIKIVLIALLPTASFADPIYNGALEYRVNMLEHQVSDMSRALTYLQKRVDELSSYPPAAPVDAIAACMVVDSGYSKTFLGVAKNKLDAEFAARNACQNSVSAGFCSTSAHLKCDDNFKPPYVSGFVCMITDSGYSKNFRGAGRTAVEAEAKAKQSCQASVSAGFCGNVTARCEEQQQR